MKTTLLTAVLLLSMIYIGLSPPRQASTKFELKVTNRFQLNKKSESFDFYWLKDLKNS